MKKIPIEFNYKYKITKEVSYESCFHKVLDNKINSTDLICDNITEEITEWKDYDSLKTIEGKITVGIFTNTTKGQNIEWIPTLYGKKLNEWASWTTGLNNGLTNYYTFNETSGDLINQVDGTWNGTNQGATTGQEGIINNSWDFDKGVPDYVNFTAGGELIPKGTNPFSIST